MLRPHTSPTAAMAMTASTSPHLHAVALMHQRLAKHDKNARFIKYSNNVLGYRIHDDWSSEPLLLARKAIWSNLRKCRY